MHVQRHIERAAAIRRSAPCPSQCARGSFGRQRKQPYPPSHQNAGIDVDAFIERHPRVFHMAQAGAWPTIHERGLLSTTALLDLFEYGGTERRLIESARRAEMVTIEHPMYGRAVIRDNKPLREQLLADCLEDMTTVQWYELLNRKTFFWVSPAKLAKLLNARAYRNHAHDVLVVDTRKLLERNLDRIALAPINTGATLYPSASPRGSRTFRPIAAYDLPAMIRRRGKADAITELVVDYSVSSIEDVVVRVERRERDRMTDVLWP